MRLVCLCLAASLALAAGCAFAQPAYDDYDPARLPSCTVPTDIALPVWPASPTDESLVAYAQALARCPYLQADVDGARWEVVSSAGGYSVLATVGSGERCTFVFLPDGQLAAYQATDSLPPLSQRLTPHEGFGDELAVYALAFLDAVAPSVSNALEAFTQAEQENHEGTVTGSIRALTYVTGSQRDGACFEIELEPVVRVVSYRLHPAMLQHLWKKSTFSNEASSLCVINASRYQEKQASVLAPEALWPSVQVHLKERYGETDASLRRFDVECELLAEGEPAVWFFNLRCCAYDGGHLDNYQVWVDAQTGEMMEAAAAEEGKG